MVPFANRRQFLKLGAQTAGAVIAMTSLPNSIRLAMAGAQPPADDQLWLEPLQGSEALNWVKQQNQRTLQQFAQDSAFPQLEKQVLDILNKETQIPGSPNLATITTTSGRTRKIRAACCGAPRWTSTASRSQPGKRCWISMRWAKRKGKSGCITVRSRWSQNIAIA